MSGAPGGFDDEGEESELGEDGEEGEEGELGEGGEEDEEGEEDFGEVRLWHVAFPPGDCSLENVVWQEDDEEDGEDGHDSKRRKT